MPTAWFIRHGESEANAGLPTTSPASVRLTSRGRKQGEYIARAFTKQPDRIITSPYIRTKQTAIPTIERFPRSLQCEWQVQEFTYLSPSDYQNTTIEQRRPLAHAYWQRLDPCYEDGEGAESFSQFIYRVQKTLKKLTTLEDDFIAIFSHEQFIRAILWTLYMGEEWIAEFSELSEGMECFYRFLKSFSMRNGSIVQLTWEPGKMPVPGKIRIDHLPECEEEAPEAVWWLRNIVTALALPQPTYAVSF
jgi:broad specificity phosphatase PhoE